VTATNREKAGEELSEWRKQKRN